VKVGASHSPLNGYEWLLVHEPEVWAEVEKIIRALDARGFKTKISREKTMPGVALYSPKAIDEAASKMFREAGRRESRTSYWVTDDCDLIRKTMLLPERDQKDHIEAAGKRAIRSYNQTDFVKRRVAVEVQFGKYSFIAYDLFVKHLAFFVGDTIDVGIEILPMKSMQEHMSSGPGYYEGALYDIARQGRGVPAVPLVLVGVEP
jgi:hypothetical protein